MRGSWVSAGRKNTHPAKAGRRCVAVRRRVSGVNSGGKWKECLLVCFSKEMGSFRLQLHYPSDWELAQLSDPRDHTSPPEVPPAAQIPGPGLECILPEMT